MFASLLAASRASSRGRVGCTRTDALMNDGRAVPSGSNPSSRPGPAFSLTGVDGPALSGSAAYDADFASGCRCGEGEPPVAECRGDWKPEAGVGMPAEGVRGDGVCLTNIDFVPSTKRPPSGGPDGVIGVVGG